MSSQDLPQGARVSPVSFKPFGNILKLSFQNSGTYAGILSQPALRKILIGFTLRFKGMLISSRLSVKEKPKINVSSIQEYNTRVVVFGLEMNKSAVGRQVLDAHLFLPTLALS